MNLVSNNSFLNSVENTIIYTYVHLGKLGFLKNYKLLYSLLRDAKTGTKGRASCYFPQRFLQTRNSQHSQRRRADTEQILPAAL